MRMAVEEDDEERARATVARREEIHAALVTMLPRLRRFCLGLARSREGGDELCQEAISRALANVERFTPGTRIDSWLFRIARNLHIDALRRLRTRGSEVEISEAPPMPGDDGVAVAESRSEFARVRLGFAQLPEEQRMLMLLIAVEGYSYKEAAEILDVPIGTVMSRVSRARRALDRHLHAPEEAAP